MPLRTELAQRLSKCKLYDQSMVGKQYISQEKKSNIRLPSEEYSMKHHELTFMSDNTNLENIDGMKYYFVFFLINNFFSSSEKLLRFISIYLF